MKLFRDFAYSILLAALVSACSQKNADYEVLAARDIKCPDGAQLEYRPWGQAGMMAICQIKHGPVLMAENGHIAIEGENFMGEPSGEQRWLDSSGKIIKSEKYPMKSNVLEKAKR